MLVRVGNLASDILGYNIRLQLEKMYIYWRAKLLTFIVDFWTFLSL